MAKLARGPRYALAALLLLGAGGLVARSPRARASIRAAYVGFRDPARVRDAPGDPLGEGSTAAPPPEIEQPELAADFGRAVEGDLADAGPGGLASLTLPDLPIPISKRTLRFVTYFSTSEKGREAFAVRYRRAGRYRGLIEQSLRDAELPEDLLWLVAVVSAFEPQATSPEGAAGLFQFMPETGARYGLARSELADERRNIPRSTAAGVAHLRDLFERYHQWDLALAAYDSGVERLDEALARLAERRGPRDAKKPVELSDLVEARLIPKETANFVPQIQAFAIVAANRGRFGLDDLDPAAPLDFGEIAVPPNTPLRLVARAAGISIALVRDYNPGLLRDRTPPDGGDTLVSLPADRVAAALAAFPTLYARESERLAAASASASAASANAGAPPASASAAASAKPSEPPSDRFTIAGGVVIERRAAEGSDASVTARVEILERGAPAPGAAFDVPPIPARSGDLPAALGRAAQAVHALVTDGGEAAVAARRRAGDPTRQRLAKTPYGTAWIALGDRLFGPGSPLAGTVLASPALPLTSVAIADTARPGPGGRLRITVTVTSPAPRAAVADAAERAFSGVLEGRATVAPYPRDDRIDLDEPVPSPRVVFGWLTPVTGEPERAALRLAVLALAHNEVGKVARALVTDTHVAVHVRGFLDLGDRAAVAAVEVVPAVLHTEADVERETAAALDAFTLTPAELAAVKTQLRARLQAEEKHAGSAAEPRDAALARLARLRDLSEAVSGDDLSALVKRVFAPGHRVIVTTRPRG